MYSFIVGKDDLVADFVVSNLKGVDNKEQFIPYTAIGLEKKGKLIAGVIYKNYYGHDIEMVIASTERWATKNTIKGFLSYPFNQLKVVRVTAIAAKPNKKARTMLDKLGFKLEGTARKGMDGIKDACIYGMLAGECKWL